MDTLKPECKPGHPLRHYDCGGCGCGCHWRSAASVDELVRLALGEAPKPDWPR